MHIALVCGSYPPRKCGVGDYTARLAEALAAAGQQVTVITSAGPAPPDEGGVRVLRTVSEWDVPGVAGVVRLLGAAGVDVVNIQYPTQEYGRRPMVNLLPWLVRAQLRLPAVATVHEYGSYRVPGRLRLALTARLSRAVIATNRAEAELLERWAGGPAARYTTIPIGSNLPCAPPAAFSRPELRARLGAGPNTVVLAFFGFISPSKGVELLLPALARALALDPHLDLQLWLLTDREPAAARYQAYHAAFAQALGGSVHAGRVVWTGYLEPAQASAHLLSADLAILPFLDGASLRRGSLLAALTHGLPVISTTGTSTAGDGLGRACGVQLVPAGDAQALADAILALARDREARATLAAHARHFAGQHSWGPIADRTLAVYRGALGRAEP